MAAMAAVVAATFLMAALSACDGLSSRPDSRPSARATVADAAPGSPAPRAGGSLRLPGADPTTLDPALVRDVTSAQYLYEIYSGLLTLAHDLAVVPDLADAWAVAPSGTVYTFTLRTDAVFHDGRPLTSQDVAYSLTRACSPELASPVAATYLGDIVGCVAHQSGRAAAVAGIATPDPHTVVLTIDAPKAYFPAKLTYPTAFVLDRAAVEAEELAARPNGSGPFRLAEYRPEEALVLRRNERYYGGAPYLDTVEFDLRPVDAMSRYENGELDATPVGLADLARASDPLNPLSQELLVGPGSLDVTYLAFDTRVAPFDDPHVRRALNLALDKERLAEVVLRGGVTPAWGILPPAMPGYSPAVSPFRFDPVAARAELAASRYGSAEKLPRLTLFSSGEGGVDATLLAVADFLGEELGVEIELEQAPYPTFQRELEEGRYGLYALGWSADYPDPQDFLDLLFHSSSPLNSSGYENAAVDALLEEARVQADPDRRLALYHRAERQILADGAWLPLFHTVDRWLVAPEVQGFTVPPIVLPRLAGVWLER